MGTHGQIWRSLKTGDATEVDMGKKYPPCLYLSLPSQQALGDLEYMFVVVSAEPPCGACFVLPPLLLLDLATPHVGMKVEARRPERW